MRVFVTGASGWIGSGVVPLLLAAGHDVQGLARSEQSAARLRAAGAEAVDGQLDDLAGLRAAADGADAVIHLAFKHDFSDYAASGRSERAAMETFGEVLEGTGKPLLFASGVALLGPGRVVTEEDASPFIGRDAPRGGVEELAMGFADRGIRPVALRFAPTVHGAGDHGFMAQLVAVAREKGVAGYVGDGSNRWPAVHRDDTARLIVRALENPDAARVVHAVAEEGVAARDIAEAIGRGAGLPAASIDPDHAEAHFGWIGAFFRLDIPASSALTRERFGWEPAGPTLLEDLDAGHYFTRAAA
ncbi:SDR family oxidoreductase [Leifsonia sp. fls2-241-R2A-40a]|uniref:SDR family oxidoreductase n=1 Tax=Leifsonia sp. fls2-241-R2A-40a TaxID=3040290 RepID=UPI0025508308|nr:SDR family oxidoreductase [Leifsonia sp. fls2-241-R2A-40a]